jgi:trans-4-hydroxy-L-proline dehydratase
MSTSAALKNVQQIKEPKNLSERMTWLRDYYYKGADRAWNNEFTAWTTGTPWDTQYNEITYYIVPETYPFLPTFVASFRQGARTVNLADDFWSWSLPERRAWFVREVMTKHLPCEILPGDLIAGARFNVMTSTCLTKKEAAEFDRLVVGKGGTRQSVKWAHDHGYGNAGATSGHLIPDYPRVLARGWRGIVQEVEHALDPIVTKPISAPPCVTSSPFSMQPPTRQER